MTRDRIYDWADDEFKRDWWLAINTCCILGAYVAAVAVGTLGVVAAVGGRPAGLTLLAIATVIAAVAHALHRFEDGP